jgi:methionine biosynthesis protein MetW
VVEQLLRIAKHVIVSFPNFGHWKNRLYLLGQGRMPVTEQLSFAWYETPNIHFCTIDDFTAMCEDIGCRIERRIALNGNGRPLPKGLDMFENLLGAQGLFVLQRKW